MPSPVIDGTLVVMEGWAEKETSGKVDALLEEYPNVVYLKSEFLDYVYLQQNTFDAVDGATGAERQRYMFDRISKVLEGSFTLPDKDTARRYFLELRQMFMDLNYLPMDSEEFKRQEAGIEAKIAERSSANA